MKSSEGNSRRKFLFGVGAFAAGLFLPSKKLIFPMGENPLAFDPGGFSMPSVEPDGNSTGNKLKRYVWLVTRKVKSSPLEMRMIGEFRATYGAPPRSENDGWRMPTAVAEELLGSKIHRDILKDNLVWESTVCRRMIEKRTDDRSFLA